jgi:heme-degrading monooxygenase HmoA
LQRYMRLAIYDQTRGTFQELSDTVKDGLLPRLEAQPGFVQYGVADCGDRKVCSITIWETREAAAKSVDLAATWVKENISDRVKLETTYVGELALFHGAPVLA